MGIVSTGFSAIGRLAALVLLVAAFGFGLASVVYLSLQGSEIKVPEITGKDFSESEKELAALGLKIKKRADRVSGEAPNTVIEQLPKPGDTVKTGQMIMVVTSKGGGTDKLDQAPPTLKDTTDEDDSDKIEEMISEKPVQKKAKPNAPVRKKADTARDVTTGDTTATDTGTTTTTTGTGTDTGTTKKEPGGKEPAGDKPGKEPATGGTTKPPATTAKPPATTKPPTETHSKPTKP